MGNDIIKRIADFIDEEKLLTPDSSVIIGLSGGADSVALLSILSQLGFRPIACHCNFQLRGKESIRDRNHAATVAATFNAPFEEITFDTVDYAADNGISIEMAARELRYQWFEQIRRQYDAQAIAVAHHRDDNAETLLLNLIRGTGLTGLTGMKPRNEYIVRPLLCVSRQEITEYLSQKGLAFVTDSTNLETLYTRNKIRLEIMPLLRQINPAVDNCIERTISYLRESYKLYSTAIDYWKQKICTFENENLYINLQTLQTTPSPETLLFEIISPLGFNAAQIHDITTNIQTLQSGKQYFSATYRIVTDRQSLIVQNRQNRTNSDTVASWQEKECGEKNEIRLSYHPADGFIIPRTPDTACFDADKLKFPLTLRRWRQGDKFRPFGMTGQKKLSDYFNDHKYSLIEKEKTLLLCDQENVLWIVGKRAADDARVTSATCRILVAQTIK